MNKKRLNIVFIIFDIALMLLYIGASWYFADILIDFPQRSLVQVAESMQERGYRTDPAEFGLPEPEDVTIPVDEEIQLAGWYFDNPTNGQCGLIFLHGHTGARLHGLIYSEPFWERGCDLLMFDARHHGESTGEFGTYGFFEKEDTRVALRWFEQKTGLDTHQIGLAGVSYGAATVLQAAALEPSIAFVIADSPYQDLATIVREQAVNQYGSLMFLLEPGAFFFAGLRADFRPTQVSPEDAAADIQAPVFLTHSLQDEYTLPDHSRAIATNLDPSQSVLELTDWGAPHAEAVYLRTDEFHEMINEFLQTYASDYGVGSELSKVLNNTANRQDWYELIGWSEPCESQWELLQTIQPGGWNGVVFYPVSEQTYFVSATCDMGPYWSTGELFLLNLQSTLPTIHQLSLKTVYLDENGKLVEGIESQTNGTYHFDPNSKMLTYNYKGGATPACGHYYVYMLDEDNFILQEARQNKCDDNPSLQPEEWEKIY